MYVCVCNRVTDREIRRAVNDGHKTLNCLSKELSVGSCCGRCKDCVREILADAAETVSVPVSALSSTAKGSLSFV